MRKRIKLKKDKNGNLPFLPNGIFNPRYRCKENSPFDKDNIHTAKLGVGMGIILALIARGITIQKSKI